MSVVSWQKSFHLIYRCLLAFEGSIDNLKINNFTENQSEVAHLVLHDSLVCVIAMQAKHFEFATLKFTATELASTSSQVIARKHGLWLI